jgi:hypothetical protein
MSSPRFEAFLARLYSDPDFLRGFLGAPERVTADSGLDPRERRAALAIDRAGLLLAARSYALKRARRRQSPRWLASLYGSILPLVKKFRTRRPAIDPHL